MSMKCPEMSDNAGWDQYHKEQWQQLANDTTQQEWVRKLAKDQADNWDAKWYPVRILFEGETNWYADEIKASSLQEALDKAAWNWPEAEIIEVKYLSFTVTLEK